MSIVDEIPRIIPLFEIVIVQLFISVGIVRPVVGGEMEGPSSVPIPIPYS